MDSFLLKEDGDYLLLELGDRIILESVEVVPVVFCAEKVAGFSKGAFSGSGFAAGVKQSSGFGPGATAATGC